MTLFFTFPSYTGTATPGCCHFVEVVQGQESATAVKEASPDVFTNYRIEGDLLNGKAHYSSYDHQTAIAYNNYGGGWLIQKHHSRGTLNAFAHTIPDTSNCPAESHNNWKYHDGGKWPDAGEGLKVKCRPCSTGTK